MHHNAATRNAAMYNVIFSHRNSNPFFYSVIAVMPSLFFSIARDNVLHRAHRLSTFASLFPFATMVYCTKQQEIYQESQRWESAKVSHKRLFALLTPEIRGWKMAQMLQKPVFALPGCQWTSVNTLLCDTLGLAETQRCHH